MQRRFLAFALSALLGLAPIFVSPMAFAKGGTHSFSSHASVSHSPPPASHPPASGGFSNTHAPSPSHQPGPFTSHASVAPPSAPVATPARSARDAAVNRQMSADAYASSQTARARTASTGSMASASGPRYQRAPDSADRVQTRTVYVNHYYHDRYIPPHYGYYSYGRWSDTFMTLMMYNAMFGYNHYNDPDYQAWHAQAMMQAQTDAQLRAQLAANDAEIARLRAQGAPVNPNYVPADVPQDVMYANAAPAGQQAVPVMHRSGGNPLGTFLLWVLVIAAFGGLAWLFLRKRSSAAGQSSYRY